MRNDKSDDGALVFAGCATAAIAMGVWGFSNALGLDISTGASVCMRLFLVTAAVFVSWKWGDDFDIFSLGNVWPIFLALFWSCWWPALDFWAIKALPPFYSDDSVSIWWAAWYTKWGVSQLWSA